MAEKNSVFETLNAINVNEHTEPKGNLTYLSWVWAWQMVKLNYPDAIYTIYENPDGWNYFTDGRTAWVKTGVTIEGIEHIEYLPVMNYKNKSIPLEQITSFDVNTAIQRSITKACARHGLGLYIYAGEDLPNIEQEKQKEEERKIAEKQNQTLSEKDLTIITNMLGDSQVKWALKAYKISDLSQMTYAMRNDLLNRLNSQGKKNGK